MVTMQGGVFGAVAAHRCRPAGLPCSGASPLEAIGVDQALRPLHRARRRVAEGRAPAASCPARRERRRQVDLVKCLLGYYRADDGSFLVDGREVAIERPADADRSASAWSTSISRWSRR